MKKSFGKIFSVFFVLLISTAAHADVRRVTIDTAALRGLSAEIAFDFIDGGLPSNTITVSDFFTDGALGTYVQTGTVAGDVATSLRFFDDVFFTEHLQHANLGTSISFSLDDSGNAPLSSSFPDAFSLFLLDSAGDSVVTTSDPSGANALFSADVGRMNGFKAYTGPDFSVTVSAVPEPASLTLAGLGMVLISLIRRAGGTYERRLPQDA